MSLRLLAPAGAGSVTNRIHARGRPKSRGGVAAVGFVIKTSDRTGWSAWVLEPRVGRVERVGSPERARVFSTHEDAEREADTLSRRFVIVGFRYDIEPE